MESNDLEVDLKSLEVTIEKFPMAESKNMFESFLIIGYDDLYYQEKIVKEAVKEGKKKQNLNMSNIIKDKKKQDEYFFIEFHCRNLPTILNSITSDFNGPILAGNQIIENVFPIPPSILIEIEEKENNKDKENNKEKDNNKEKEKVKTVPFEKKPYFVIFSNIQNNVVNYGFGHIFYEKKIHENLKIHIPKAFVIISQYPFYNIFNNLCEEIKELFMNQQLQIPIEIQIYNIINFTPATIDTGLKMTLIPKEELLLIKNMKDQDTFFFRETQKKYYPEQLSGYRETEINFCYAFNAMHVDIILEIYLNLISGKIIGFFCDDITELSLILHIFHQFLFPFAPNENVSCLSPIKFFCNDTVGQNIVGFLCDYEKLENYDPFREIKEGQYRCLTDEEENMQLDPLFFKCDYILDLNKKVLIEPDKYSYEEDSEDNSERKRLKEYIKRIMGKLAKNNVDTDFERILLELYNNLKENLYKLISMRKMKKKIFSPFVSEELQKINRAILEPFYKFNLNLAYLYYQKVSQYKGDYNISKEEQRNMPLKPQKDCDLSSDEYFFFTNFGNSLFGNCLDNFVGGYSIREPTIYKAPKLIFENLLYLLKIKKYYNLDEKKFLDILDVYDELYRNKIKDIDEDEKVDNKNDNKNKKSSSRKNSKEVEITSPQEFTEEEKLKEEEIRNMNHKTFTFFEFYKYYVSSPEIALYFYNIANPEFVAGKTTKTQNIKYTFRYKKHVLDENILYKYIYKLKQMDEKTRVRCFKDIIKYETIPKEPIKSYDNFISAALEKYYIENKLIDNNELINFSILGFVILTVSKHKYIYFKEEINKIIEKLVYLSRKFAEIILSVCLKYFINEKEPNIEIYKTYFNIYDIAITNKAIFPNDKLIILEKEIHKFIQIIEKKNKSFQKYETEIGEAKNKNYKLDYNKKVLDKLNVLELTKDMDENDKKKKLNIKFEIKSDKIKLEYPTVYPIQKIYEKVCNFLDEYYKSLDYNIIIKEKEEFNKLIIYLLFYVKILKERKDKDKDKKHIKEGEIKAIQGDIELFLINCIEK